MRSGVRVTVRLQKSVTAMGSCPPEIGADIANRRYVDS